MAGSREHNLLFGEREGGGSWFAGSGMGLGIGDRERGEKKLVGEDGDELDCIRIVNCELCKARKRRNREARGRMVICVIDFSLMIVRVFVLI